MSTAASPQQTPSNTRDGLRPSEIYRGYRGHEIFRRIAAKTAHGVGHPLTFVAAIGIVVIWGASGHFFHYSDTWQLVINTGTTIITFLMVFLIQNTQNRDSHAIHLKLDELIHANVRARNRMMMLEELSEEELDALQKEFNRKACERAEAQRASGHQIKTRTPASRRAGRRRHHRSSEDEGGHRS